MFEKLKEIIEEKLNAEGAAITEETSFKEDLDADSLDLFELVMALEDEFDVEIPSEEAGYGEGRDGLSGGQGH
jgi:acyl carrier protein